MKESFLIQINRKDTINRWIKKEYVKIDIRNKKKFVIIEKKWVLNWYKNGDAIKQLIEYRIRLLISGAKTLKLQNSLATAIPNYKFQPGIKLSVDVDPINFN